MELLWMCNECDKLDMWKNYAMDHSGRTGHRIIIQTPEAKLEAISRRPYTSEEKAAIVARVEVRLADSIIDGKNHTEECKCHLCFDRALNRLLEASNRSVEDI